MDITSKSCWAKGAKIWRRDVVDEEKILVDSDVGNRTDAL